MHAKLPIPALVIALTLPTAVGAQTLESNFRTTGPGVVAAFEPQRMVLQTSSAVIYDGRKEAIYGVVVSPQGDILTKASELQNIKKLAITVDRKKFTEVTIVAIDPTWDVAHLKVVATDLVPVVYAPTSAVPQGTWVVANGATSLTRRRALAGIVSAKIREVPPAGGAILGVTLKQDPKEGDSPLELVEVQEKSGSEEAGLQAGDVITAINDQPVKTREDIAKALKDAKAGARIQVTYRRKGKSTTVEVRLMAREQMADQLSRNDQMSGEFSKRRSGFPRILQHDILGASSVVGGPLLDLDGRCLGMNIARATRAESFAIPVEDLKTIATRMLADAKNNAAQEKPATPVSPEGDSTENPERKTYPID
ncbi:MAG: PDZ domain-containing protein [Akkermansiaceae bacterium]|nr:PDZ domain-containing protein [Akkermansiaceae bacterium]